MSQEVSSCQDKVDRKLFTVADLERAKKSLQDLAEKVKSSRTSSSAVPTSSHSLRRPAKRKSNSSDGSKERVAKIKIKDEASLDNGNDPAETPNQAENKDESTNVSKEEQRVLVHKAAQTVPTVQKFSCPKEADLQKRAYLEKSLELYYTKKELSDQENSLKSLQDNIWQLLNILVPEFDYGDPENVENVIIDFIRDASEQDDGPSTSGN